MTDRYPCPCCGHLVFNEPSGSYGICPICFWEDDGLQLAYPLMEGGANSNSLVDCQREQARDAGWEFNPLTDPHLDFDSPEDDRLWKSVTREANLYYWQPGYWLSGGKPKAEHVVAPNRSLPPI